MYAELNKVTMTNISETVQFLLFALVKWTVAFNYNT